MTEISIEISRPSDTDHLAALKERARRRNEKWRRSKGQSLGNKDRLTNVFYACACGSAAHLACVPNIALTGTLSAASGATIWIPVLQVSHYTLQPIFAAISWWGMEKLRRSKSPKEVRNRKWAAGIGCALVMGGGAWFDHHNFVDEYRYFANLSPAQQETIRMLAKDSPAGKNLTPVEFIRAIDCIPQSSLSKNASKLKRMLSNKIDQLKEGLVP
jgi:hypothetical protein